LILLDVNVLVYAHREERPEYEPINAWLSEVVNSSRPFGVPDIVLSGFLRIVTHPRTFSEPSPLESALAFVDDVRCASNYVAVNPGPSHWPRFAAMCRVTGATGNEVPDAYLAALAIDTGSEWITADRGFARFPGLRWRHPLDLRA
jgi:toxin-antitoxin system PIN domain toxin